MAKKRIYNPYTGKYYKIAERDGTVHRKGQIIGKWRPKKGPKKGDGEED